MLNKIIFHLQVSTFAGFCPDAYHYSGEIVWDLNGEHHELTVQSEISEKEAIALNKSDGAKGSSRWKQGDISIRFQSEADLIKAALADFAKISREGDVLLKGSRAYLDPQKVLAGPAAFVRDGNRLYELAEKIDFYENDTARMEIIYKDWVALKKMYDLV